MKSSKDTAWPLKICWRLPFHVLHPLAYGINFQVPRMKIFLILILHATNTFLTFKVWTQPLSTKETNPNAKSPKTRRRSINCSSSRHIEHILDRLKSLLLSTSYMGIFPLVVVHVKSHFHRSFKILNISDKNRGNIPLTKIFLWVIRKMH